MDVRNSPVFCLGFAGALVGQYTDTKGQTHGFLAEPVTGNR
jgi:hypothetical protein